MIDHIIQQKHCGLCNATKPASEFYKQSSQRDGLRSNCKSCVRAYNETYRHTEHGKFLRKETGRRYSMSEKGRAHILEYRSNRRQTAIGKAVERRANLRKKYALTEAEFFQILEQQDSKCAICHKTGRLVVDHCHMTGKVRGILCSGCNTGLGKFGDTIEGVQRAIEYLRRSLV